MKSRGYIFSILLQILEYHHHFGLYFIKKGMGKEEMFNINKTFHLRNNWNLNP